MNWHIYYPCLNIGGVETLLVRLSRWLSEQGHSVHLRVAWNGPLDPMLDSRVQFSIIGPASRLPWRRQLIRTDDRDGPTVVFAPDPWSTMQAVALHRHHGRSGRFLAGLYHPRIWRMHHPYPAWITGALRRAVGRRAIHPDSLLSMNEVCRAGAASDLGTTFLQSPIAPLPVADLPRRRLHRKPGKLVSVGRLVDFKTYNVYMCDVVAELHRRGHNHVEWHVYGDGPLGTAIHDHAFRLGVSRAVHLHGSVPYESFASVIADADVFIGMGTALVEAGLCGVPGVVAVDSYGPVTYGLIHNLTGYCVGEVQQTPPQRAIADIVEQVMRLNDDQYADTCDRVRQHCEQYLIDRIGPMYTQAAAGAAHWRNPTLLQQTLLAADSFVSGPLRPVFGWIGGGRHRVRSLFSRSERDSVSACL